MKLLRLIDLEAESTGSIVFSLNEPITLHPESEVALQECTIDTMPQRFVVDVTNNQIHFSTNGANASPQVAFLQGGVYDQDGLIFEVERALNAGLDLAFNSSSGVQFKAELDSGKTKISIDRCDPDVYFPQITTGGTFNGANTVLTKTSGTTTVWNCYAVSQIPLIAGAGYYCGVVDTAATGSVGIGIVTSKTIATGDPQPMVAAVYVNEVDKHYYYKLDAGTPPIDTGIVAQNGDLFGIKVNQGDRKLIYRRANADVEIDPGSIPLSPDPFFPVMMIDGPANTTLSLPIGLFHSTDPFVTASDSQVDAKSRTWISIHFENPLSFGCADLLGFEHTNNILKAQFGSFTGKFNLLTTPERLSLLVLLESMPGMHAYDSGTGGRRPILATISTYLEKGGSKIEYQPSNLNWIDIGNQHKMDLSIFRIRVVDAVNSPLALGDGCSFTLLFR